MTRRKEWAGPINWAKVKYGTVDLCGVANTKNLDRQLYNGVEVKVTIEITLDASSAGNWDGVSREYYGSAVVKKVILGPTNAAGKL